jgi:hypothetical protein
LDLALLGCQSLVTLLCDSHADALAFGKGNPGLGAFTDGEDVTQPKEQMFLINYHNQFPFPALSHAPTTQWE